MKHILEKLWDGDLVPSEKPYTASKRTQMLTDNIHMKKEKLAKLLNENQLKLLEEYSEIINELLDQAEKEAFINGFKLGADMMIEVLK